jgi:AcrR family transcriptional regulator
MLVENGIGAVKVDRLARALGVTRGGFYWHFRSQQDLLDSLLESWRNTNTNAILRILNAPGSPEVRFQGLVDAWIQEREFDPHFDTAVRSWGQTSSIVAHAVRQADNQRIAALTRLFRDANYDAEEAFIRARVTYFHQVGYYALGIHESKRLRTQLSHTYYAVLTGFNRNAQRSRRI